MRTREQITALNANQISQIQTNKKRIDPAINNRETFSKLILDREWSLRASPVEYSSFAAQ